MSDTPDLRSMLEDFHEKFEDEMPGRDQANQEFRRDLLEEEFEEYVEVVEADGFDAEAMVEELADMVYLCYGTAVCHALDLDAALREIHEENMAKDRLKTPEDYE